MAGKRRIAEWGALRTEPSGERSHALDLLVLVGAVAAVAVFVGVLVVVQVSVF